MPGATYYRTTTTTTTTSQQTKRSEPPVPAVRTKAVSSKEMNKILDDVKAAESKNVVIDTLAALVTDCNATAEYLRSRSSSRQNLNDIPDDEVHELQCLHNMVQAGLIYHVNEDIRPYTPPSRTVTTITETKRQAAAATSPVSSKPYPDSGDSPVIIEYKLRLHSPYQAQYDARSPTQSLRRRGDTPERRTPSLERVCNEFGIETPRDRSMSRTRSETPMSRRMIVLEEPKDRDAPICAYCDRPVYGPCLTALAPNARKAQKFHPSHFMCAYCTKPLNLHGTYREHQRKPYCHECFYRLYSGHIYEVDSDRANRRV